MCIAHTPAPRFARDVEHLRVAARPVTSLMISAPAASAARATAALDVSIEMASGICRAERFDRPAARARSSSAASTGVRIGPRAFAADVEDVGAFAASRRAWAMAACGSKNWPPSEKLSGVTLTMPITSGRFENSSVRVLSRRALCSRRREAGPRRGRGRRPLGWRRFITRTLWRRHGAELTTAPP